jgi:thiol-disulfide isomerase/thioredoxin
MNRECRINRRAFLGGLVATVATVFVALPNTASPVPGPAPEIRGDVWINTAPLNWSELRGKVVLVEFWTFECWNCHNVEPYIKQWHARYAAEGLQVVTVHAPEFDRERDPDKVRDYVKRAAIGYPVVLDNDFANWKRYDNRYWPTVYLVDKRGQLRYRKIGEGGYDKTETTIRALLAE